MLAIITQPIAIIVVVERTTMVAMRVSNMLPIPRRTMIAPTTIRTPAITTTPAAPPPATPTTTTAAAATARSARRRTITTTMASLLFY